VSRRQVRVHASFFDRLDELLPAERTTTGTPSATDFLMRELPAIIDRFATAYEMSTLPVAGDPEIRVIVAAGILVDYVAVYAVLADDDAVEVIYLELS
jgi:hypothetical protein